jgi:hypothetical protein
MRKNKKNKIRKKGKATRKRKGSEKENEKKEIEIYPGDKLVLIQGCTDKPASTALRASKPEPRMTEGLLVFVQLVIAAIATDPCASL